jgi:surface polysaccharide O-acyltransferase-like enzyme
LHASASACVLFMSPPVVIVCAITFCLTWMAGLVAIWQLSPLLGMADLALTIYALTDLMQDAGEL